MEIKPGDRVKYVVESKIFICEAYYEGKDETKFYLEAIGTSRVFSDIGIEKLVKLNDEESSRIEKYLIHVDINKNYTWYTDNYYVEDEISNNRYINNLEDNFETVFEILKTISNLRYFLNAQFEHYDIVLEDFRLWILENLKIELENHGASKLSPNDWLKGMEIIFMFIITQMELKGFRVELDNQINTNELFSNESKNNIFCYKENELHDYILNNKKPRVILKRQIKDIFEKMADHEKDDLFDKSDNERLEYVKELAGKYYIPLEICFKSNSDTLLREIRKLFEDRQGYENYARMILDKK
jgi:hypothetical protein